MVLLLVSAHALAHQVTASESATKTAFNPYSYLPPGSKILNPAKDVVFADLDGDGVNEAVIFYLIPDGEFVKPSIIALKKQGEVWQEIWHNSADVGWDFIAPSGVYDMLKTGQPQIYSYISVGASCGGLLDVYQFDPLRGAIVSIDGWPEHSCAHNLKIKDLNDDGIPEIIFTETNYSTIPDIYWWNGERFMLSDSNFARYYDAELQRLVRDALASNNRAPDMWGRMAVQIYMLQHRYREAVDFCQQLLRAAHSRDEAGTPSTRVGASERAATDAMDAIFHRWMGEAYKSLNQLREARNEFEKARELDLAAKRVDPYHMIPFPLN
ncbi:MAG: hypothetical protein ACYDA9_06050 [Terriglobia bacterium]